VTVRYPRFESRMPDAVVEAQPCGFAASTPRCT